MTISDANSGLYDMTFVIGTFRRRSAIKTLAKSGDTAGVVALAEALAKGGHPNDIQIASALLRLSAERDAEPRFSCGHAANLMSSFGGADI